MNNTYQNSQYHNYNPYTSNLNYKPQKEIEQEEAFEVQFSESDYQEDNIYTDQAQNNQLFKNQNVQKNQVAYYQEEEFDYIPKENAQYQANYNGSSKVYKSKEQVKEQAIQLISFDKQSEKFILNNEALSIIKLYEEPICFVAVAGKYRTGKSFILNKILNLKGQGFKVDPSTQSCTQGIWMWSHPIYNNGKQIFFIDTEGSTSIEGNKKHDAKIFSLALLISSLFIFNSVGAIDERSVSELQLTTQISKNIQISVKPAENEKLICEYTPKFIWLLRDFVLEIVDNRNNQIDSNTYMNNCLYDESSASKSSAQSKKIRESLLQYFKKRECITMIRPANTEEELQNLNNIAMEKLKPQFVQQLQFLKKKIFEMVEVKVIEGVVLNSGVFVQLLQNYIQQINEKGGVPNVLYAWDNIMERECQKKYEECIQNYNDQKIKICNNNESLDDNQILSQMNKLKEQVMRQFNANPQMKSNNTYYKEYLEKLQLYVDNQEQDMNKYNDQYANTDNQEIILDMKHDLQQEEYNQKNINNFYSKINKWLQKYEKESKGQNKLQVLVEFLPNILKDNFNKIIQSLQNSSGSKDQEEKIQNLTKQLSDLKTANELEKKKNDQNLKKIAEKDESINLLQKKIQEKADQTRLLQEKDSQLEKLSKELIEMKKLAQKNKSKCGCF